MGLRTQSSNIAQYPGDSYPNGGSHPWDVWYMMSGADKTTNTDTVIRTLEESDHAQKLMTSKASRPAPAKKGKIIPAVPVVVSQGGARSSGNGKPTATSQTPATSSNAINIARAPTGIPTKTQAKEPRVDVPSTQ